MTTTKQQSHGVLGKPSRRPRPAIHTFPTLFYYIFRQWWEFAQRALGILTLQRSGYSLNLDDSNDRLRSWEFLAYAWILIAAWENSVTNSNPSGDGSFLAPAADSTFLQIGAEAFWLLIFYPVFVFRSPTRISFFEFWLAFGPVIMMTLFLDDVTKFSFWRTLDPALVTTYKQHCPQLGLLSLPSECVARLATLTGRSTSSIEALFFAFVIPNLGLQFAMMWRYSVVAQGSSILVAFARAALASAAAPVVYLALVSR